MSATPTLEDETAAVAVEAVKEPPTKKVVSQTLCKIVDGMATREEALEALDTIAAWTKQDYAVHTFGLLKTYALVPKVLDYLQDHVGKVEEQDPIKKAAAEKAAEANGEVKEEEEEVEPPKYDEKCVKTVAHVIAQCTFGGSKKDPNHDARKAVAEDMVSIFIQFKAVLVMLEAIEQGILSVHSEPMSNSSTHSDGASTSAATNVSSKLPKSTQSLWACMWNIMAKESAKESIPNDRKIKLFSASVSCMELLGVKDQKIAVNILKILRHILPPDSHFSDEGIQAIKNMYAMNKIVDAVMAKEEYWIKPDATPEVPNEGFCKSLIQFLYRYVMLPGMTEDIPASVWESRVVPLTARCMKEYPKQKEIHWCGTRILIMAFEDVGLSRESMEKLGALSAVATTVENAKSDDGDATKKKALELMSKLMPAE
jgi:hypothetical protein